MTDNEKIAFESEDILRSLIMKCMIERAMTKPKGSPPWEILVLKSHLYCAVHLLDRLMALVGKVNDISMLTPEEEQALKNIKRYIDTDQRLQSRSIGIQEAIENIVSTTAYNDTRFGCQCDTCIERREEFLKTYNEEHE